MMDLWTELQHVRRQCSDYKEQTLRDLANQREEFARVMRNIGGISRQLSVTYDVSALSPIIPDNPIICRKICSPKPIKKLCKKLNRACNLYQSRDFTALKY
ncbi:unnamed protein product [Anisakis simplex]|uniref:Uncharacterized protein n=1 Tax=Anisakis simplex TaxID=6269 RepID=A0A0M3JFS7_ANISI|nr:unnamed protein product [Anisakis simplex]